MILNEMLKSGKDIISPALVTLFNLVLCSGITPPSWDTSLLKRLHKGGSKMTLIVTGESLSQTASANFSFHH